MQVQKKKSSKHADQTTGATRNQIDKTGNGRTVDHMPSKSEASPPPVKSSERSSEAALIKDWSNVRDTLSLALPEMRILQ